MMFATSIMLVVAAFSWLATATRFAPHLSFPLSADSEVCKANIAVLVGALDTVPFFDDVITLHIASMIRSSCSEASVTMAEASRPTLSVPVPLTIEDPLPAVVEVATSPPSFQHSATLVPLTIDGHDPVGIEASFDVCPWITALPLTDSGPSDGAALTTTAISTESTPIGDEETAVVQAPAKTIPYKSTAQANTIHPLVDDLFWGAETQSNATDSTDSDSAFLGSGSGGKSVLEDLCVIDFPPSIWLSDASIAGVVPRGRAPDSLQDQFPILYLLIWWFGIGIIGSLMGSNFQSAPLFGKSWTQTFGNVSSALDKALEKGQSLDGRLGGTGRNNQALPAEYLYLIKVPAYSAFAINFAIAFFRHYHRRGWKPFVSKGLLMYYPQRPVVLINVPLGNVLQLDVLPRAIIEAQILQQRAAVIGKNDVMTGNQCRALIVAPLSEVQTISQCQELVTTRSAILPPTHGSIHCTPMNRQPLMQVIDPQRFGFMIECAVRVGPHRDVATKLIVKHLGIDHRIEEITAERDDARGKLDKEVARTQSLEFSLAEAGKTAFELLQTNTMQTTIASVMDTTKQAETKSQEEDNAESQDLEHLYKRGAIVQAKIARHLKNQNGKNVPEAVVKDLNKKPGEKIQALEKDDIASNASQDQAVAELEKDLEEANRKVADLSEASKTFESERKQAAQDHTQLIHQLKEKLAATVQDKDHLAEANQLLRDRIGRLENKKNAESTKLKSQLEEKVSALDSMKAAKTESDKANQKTIDELKQQLQEKESALKEQTTSSSLSSSEECTDTGDFARTTIDIFEDATSSGSEPAVKLFIKSSGSSPVQTSGANSTTSTPSSSRSSGSFPSWNEYFAGRESRASDTTDEWEDVSETRHKATKRGTAKADADDSSVAKKGRGFRNSSTPKRLLKFNRS